METQGPKPGVTGLGSRQPHPEGGKLKADALRIDIKLWGREVAECLAKQACTMTEAEPWRKCSPPLISNRTGLT